MQLAFIRASYFSIFREVHPTIRPVESDVIMNATFITTRSFLDII